MTLKSSLIPRTLDTGQSQCRTALIDRALYLPGAYASGNEHRELVGVPEEATFATKPELAGALLVGSTATCFLPLAAQEGSRHMYHVHAAADLLFGSLMATWHRIPGWGR